MEPETSVGTDDIKDHIKSCLQMFQQNKINSKNAWNMNIIECISQYLNSEEGISNSLQLGGSSLEVGAKVYSVRVDDIHLMGFKLAADLAKMTLGNHNEIKSEDDLVGGVVDDIVDVSTNNYLCRKRNVYTLGSHKHSIARDASTLLCKVPKLESIYFQKYTNADLSKVDNLVTNKISTDKSGFTFTLMSEECFWMSSNDPDPTLIDKEIAFTMPDHLDIQICPELENFTFDVCSVNEEFAEQYQQSSPYYCEHPDKSDEETFEINPSDLNIVETELHTSKDVGENRCKKLSSGGKCITGIWQGPNHWKFKRSQCSRRRSARKNEQKPKPDMIDFFVEASSEEETFTNTTKILKTSPQKNRFQVPINDTNVTKLINSYFLKPSVELSEDLTEEDTDHQDEPTNLSDDEQRASNSQQTVQASGVDELNYATAPKQIDMIELQEKVWSIITDISNQNSTNELRATFKEVCAVLPSVLNEPMKSEMSTSFVFVAILHLANEKNLKIIGQPDLKDFTIELDDGNDD